MILSSWAVTFGEISLAKACISEFVLAPFRLKNTFATLVNNCPDLSNARIVLLKVASSALATMASISACCCYIPSSKAGTKCFSSIRSLSD
jgi:hypothetical protein